MTAAGFRLSFDEVFFKERSAGFLLEDQLVAAVTHSWNVQCRLELGTYNRQF